MDTQAHAVIGFGKLSFDGRGRYPLLRLDPRFWLRSEVEHWLEKNPDALGLRSPAKRR